MERAPSPAEQDTGPLAELEFHWGSAYHLAVVDGVWTAQRRDGQGGTLTDSRPEGLRLLIQADYTAMRVPRGPAVSGPGRGVFAVDEQAALAELEFAWAGGGYHGFSVDSGTWSAISNAGDVFTGATVDELNRAIRAHWQAMQ